MSKTRKKRYIDDDTRAELSRLKNLKFDTEEELELKLEEIQRKKSKRSVSRIVRIFGFVFLLIIFITSCDVFYEGSVFGAFGTKTEHSAVKHYFSEQQPIIVEKAREGDRYSGNTLVGVYKNVVYTNTTTGATETVPEMSAQLYHTMFTNSSIYKLEDPGRFEAGWFKTTYYVDVNDDSGIVNVRSVKTYIDVNDRYSIIQMFGPDFEIILAERGVLKTDSVDVLYDDTFVLGSGMITILFTIDLVCLAAATIYLSIFIIKDIIDLVKGVFGESFNIASAATESIKENIGIKEKEDNSDKQPKRRSLFSDEELEAEIAEAERRVTEDRRKDDTETTKPERKPVAEPEKSESDKISPEDLDKLLSSN